MSRAIRERRQAIKPTSDDNRAKEVAQMTPDLFLNLSSDTNCAREKSTLLVHSFDVHLHLVSNDIEGMMQHTSKDVVDPDNQLQLLRE